MRGKANKLFRNNRSISLSKAGWADLNRRRGGGEGRGGNEDIKQGRRQKRTEGERMGASVTG